MRRVRFNNFQQLATYCKSEGLDIDTFMRKNKIITNRDYWTKDILK